LLAPAAAVKVRCGLLLDSLGAPDKPKALGGPARPAFSRGGSGMNALKMGVAGLLLLGLAVSARAAKDEEVKVTKEKLIGSWVADSGPFKGLVLTYKKDGTVTMAGKLKFKVKDEVKEITINEKGKYKIDGNKISITHKGRGGKEKTDTDTVTKLTDTKLEIKDAKGKTHSFTKKK
jgi:uncharacterized protein (TIGR03066 family)